MGDLQRGAESVTVERAVSEFERVRLDGVGYVRVTLGDNEGVTVEAPGEWVDDIVTRVRGGVLELGLRGNHYHLRRNGKIRFHVAARALRGLAIDGSGTIEAPRLAADSVAAAIDGAGRIQIDSIEAERVRLAIDGAGRFAVGTAKAQEVQFSIDGTGTIDVERLDSERIAVAVDGMGRVVATGTADSVEIHVDGTGEVDTRQLIARHVEVEIEPRS